MSRKPGNIIDDIAEYLKAEHKASGYVPVSVKCGTNRDEAYKHLAKRWIFDRARDALAVKGFYD